MKEFDLKYFRNYLIKERNALVRKSLEFKSQQRDEREIITEDAEIASYDLTINLNINLYERDRSSLVQIERALGKIAEGTYGQCESCEESIEINRLKARPFTTLCIDCMQEQEENKPFINRLI